LLSEVGLLLPEWRKYHTPTYKDNGQFENKKKWVNLFPKDLTDLQRVEVAIIATHYKHLIICAVVTWALVSKAWILHPNLRLFKSCQ